MSGRIAGVATVRDGDSLEIGGNRIRLIGIDAPELGQICTRAGEAWDCASAARKHLARMIENREVNCRVIRRDRFDRLLAKCQVQSSNTNREPTRDLNAGMIRDGMAVAFGADYRREEAAARREKLGLWGSQFVEPQAWRRDHPRQ